MSVTPSTKRKAFTVFLVIWAIFYAIVAIEDTDDNTLAESVKAWKVKVRPLPDESPTAAESEG